MDRRETKSPRLTELEAACRRQGLALTVQRRVVLEALAARDDHPTADELMEQVRARLPEVSRTTVYRVLDTLVELGLAVRISSPGAAARFDSRTERHHHLVCSQCECVMDIEVPALNALALPDARARRFEIVDYSIHFRGLCAGCKSRQPPAVPKRAGRASAKAKSRTGSSRGH